MADHVSDPTRKEQFGKAVYLVCSHCPAKRTYTPGKATGDSGWMVKRDKPDLTKRDRERTWIATPVCAGQK